jgi:hypothetical protein
MRQGELIFLRQQMLDQRNRELAKKSLPLPQDLAFARTSRESV